LNKHLIAIAVTAVAVTGCAAPQVQAPSPTEDLNVGIAKTCTPTAVDLSAANTTSASITMTNDGWCALHVKQKDGQPYLLGLVKSNPTHGRILIQKIGGETRIEYTADDRYVGADKFTVALRPTAVNVPDATIQVAVNVSMGEGQALVEPPKAAPAARTTPPARSNRP
jgi:hypothetical protein